MKIAALKVYVDSMIGYREGVPRILDALDECGVHGSFFFGMGTENDGSLMRRFFKDDKEIVASAPGIIRDAFRRGHDCGICGWNPREWQSKLDRLKDTTLEADIKRAINAFYRRTGARPRGFAAPGARANYISLRIQDDVRFMYCSDTFGYYPFLPKISWKTFSTPQVPSTHPPLEVALRNAPEQVVRERLGDLIDSLPDGLAVIPLNASVATERTLADPLRDFISTAVAFDVRFLTLARVIESIDVKRLPKCEIKTCPAFGVTKGVTVQVTD